MLGRFGRGFDTRGVGATVLGVGPITVNFAELCSEEEINNMKLELDKYGIQMPAFNKIGGILANELSVDEAAGRTRL